MQFQDLYEELTDLLPSTSEQLQDEKAVRLFLNKYESFRLRLKELDESTLPICEQFRRQISKLLSRLIHYCPREDVVNMISLTLSKFHGQLRCLPMEQPPNITKWPILSFKELRQRFRNVQSEHLREVYRQLDEVFLNVGIVPHLQWILRLYPQVFLLFRDIEKYIESETTIDHHQKMFIGIIAVSNFGCVYMWNRLVKKFFEFGGDRTWIESGLHSADKKFHLIALLSQVLAYNPETMVMDEKFFEKFDNLSKQYLAEAIHIISYYQSLACYAQAMGLVPEEPVDKNLLNIQGLLMPSRFSLENVYRRENSKEIEEVRTGQKMLRGFIRQQESEEEDVLNRPTKRAVRALISPMYSEVRQDVWEVKNFQNSTQEIHPLMVKASKTFNRIKAVFGKFAYFSQSYQENTESIVEQLYNQVKEPNPKLRKGSNYSIVHASEWDSINTQSILEDYFADDDKITTVFIKLSQGIEKIMMSNLNKKKFKDVEYYYQFLCHYMHLHVNYKKLISEDLTQDQKFFVKLVTRSPYLLGQEGLQFFLEKQKLTSLTMDALSIMALVAISARMQVHINISMRNLSAHRVRLSN